jgi:hypothetical protein
MPASPSTTSVACPGCPLRLNPAGSVPPGRSAAWEPEDRADDGAKPYISELHRNDHVPSAVALAERDGEV